MCFYVVVLCWRSYMYVTKIVKEPHSVYVVRPSRNYDFEILRGGMSFDTPSLVSTTATMR
ncbi:unnamed protein product [Brassica rapa subsp. trilocularis]